MVTKRIGKIVRKRRMAKGFRQDDLAQKTGISQGYLSEFENGKIINPSEEILEKLSEVLDLNIEDLRVSEADEEELHNKDIQDLITIFKSLTPNGQEVVLSHARNIQAYERQRAAASEDKRA